MTAFIVAWGGACAVIVLAYCAWSVMAVREARRIAGIKMQRFDQMAGHYEAVLAALRQEQADHEALKERAFVRSGRAFVRAERETITPALTQAHDGGLPTRALSDA